MGTSSHIPSCVVLDLDNTLYSYQECHDEGFRALTSYLSPQIGLSSSKIGYAFGIARQTVKARLGDVASSHSRLLYLEQMMIDLHMGFRPSLLLQAHQIYWAAFLNRMRLRPGVEDFLLAARLNGVHLVLLTDLTSEIQFRKVIRLGIGTLIDQVFTSELIGGEKKSMAGFSFVVSHLKPEHCRLIWFVGDGPVDRPNSDWLTLQGLNCQTRSWVVPEIDFRQLLGLFNNTFDPQSNPLHPLRNEVRSEIKQANTQTEYHNHDST